MAKGLTVVDSNGNRMSLKEFSKRVVEVDFGEGEIGISFKENAYNERSGAYLEDYMAILETTENYNWFTRFSKEMDEEHGKEVVNLVDRESTVSSIIGAFTDFKNKGRKRRVHLSEVLDDYDNESIEEFTNAFVKLTKAIYVDFIDFIVHYPVQPNRSKYRSNPELRDTLTFLDNVEVNLKYSDKDFAFLCSYSKNGGFKFDDTTEYDAKKEFNKAFAGDSFVGVTKLTEDFKYSIFVDSKGGLSMSKSD